MKLNLKLPVCFFDLEATGPMISSDRIIEIAVIKLMPTGEVIKKSNLINPTIPILSPAPAIGTTSGSSTSFITIARASGRCATISRLQLNGCSRPRSSSRY